MPRSFLSQAKVLRYHRRLIAVTSNALGKAFAIRLKILCNKIKAMAKHMGNAITYSFVGRLGLMYYRQQINLLTQFNNARLQSLFQGAS